MSTSNAANGSPAPFTTAPESMANGRDARSASAGGNPCLSFVGRAAQMRAALLARVTNDDMAAIADQLVVRAREGNMSAIKLLFRYLMHEPTPVKQPLPLPQPAPIPRSAPAAERMSAEALAAALHRLEFGPDVAQSPLRVAGGMATSSAPSPNGKSHVDPRRTLTGAAPGSDPGQPVGPSCNGRPAVPPPAAPSVG
jgi:hypothetical protein